MIKFSYWIGATVVFAALAGCTSVTAWLEHAESPPLYLPVNYRADARLAENIQRVAFLPVHGGAIASAEIAATLDTVLIKELQRQMRFEVVVLTREDCQRMFGAGDFSSTAALPDRFMERLVGTHAVDAVLFTDLTDFQAHRPLSVGLRSKLATVQDINLIWAFDEIFSAGDERMLNSVRHYYGQGDKSAPVDPMPGVLQSPTRFTAVAANIMFRTLPAR